MPNPNRSLSRHLPFGQPNLWNFFPAYLLRGVVALLVSACNAATPAGAVLPGIQLPAAPAGPTPAAASTPTVITGVLPDDPRNAVAYSMLAQPRGMPFSVQITVDTGGSQIKSEVEIESPQRILVVTSTGTVKVVDGKCYEMKTGTDWQACANPRTGDAALSAASSFLDESVINAFIATIQTAQLAGSETLDNIKTRIYEYTYISDQFGLHSEGTGRLWVAEDDALPIKQVTTSKTGGYSATTTQLFDYSPSLTVRAP
jgi:hypothetical protein